MARATWINDYTTALTTKIDNAIENDLGLNKKEALHDASSRLAALHNPAMRDLSFIKTHIEMDFGKEAKNPEKT